MLVSWRFGTIVLLLTACGPTSTRPPSQVRSLVNPAQLEHASAIVRGVDYLPYKYRDNGCYARSYYVSMELAAEGIPSSSKYIYGILNPFPNVDWTFHVASFVQLEEEGERGEENGWIFDPTFTSVPLRTSQWISKSKPQSGGYEIAVKAGSEYFDAPAVSGPIHSFAEMPAFASRDIVSACLTNHSYLGEQFAISELSEKYRTKLIDRTRELLQKLKQLGKLHNNGIDANAGTPCGDVVGSQL